MYTKHKYYIIISGLGKLRVLEHLVRETNIYQILDKNGICVIKREYWNTSIVLVSRLHISLQIWRFILILLFHFDPAFDKCLFLILNAQILLIYLNRL